MRNPWLRSLLASSLMLVSTAAVTQEQREPTCIDDAMLVFDGSSSMLEVEDGFENSRIDAARIAVREAMPEIAPFRKLGLVVYGPGFASNNYRPSCGNIRVKFPPVANAGPLVIDEVERLQPIGSTPLSGAVLKAANTLRYKQKPGVIVLLTDGQETCGSTVCDIAEQIASEGVATTVHVIGFRLKWVSVDWKSEDAQLFANERTNARCFAEKTGGQYVSTQTVEELATALRETLGCSVVG